jgi:Holliday junction resolvase
VDTLTLSRLREFRARYGVGVFGKIAQKLLALSFRRMGFTHVVERTVEGVDIDIARDAEDKYAVEVKTTEGKSITLDRGNVQALLDRARDDYRPVIAALRLAVFEKWVLAQVPVDELRAGNILVDLLRAYRMKDLEAALEPVFEDVVEAHFQGTLDRGLQYLSEQLAKDGVEVRDS